MRILIAVGIAAGAIERVFVWRSHSGALDSDEGCAARGCSSAAKADAAAGAGALRPLNR